ncbi:MAG: hypothetical protein HXL32_09345, partial [Prevotellaceae bacterium]|nr:hypothetical protein [Prevotellaceae bacterium]
TAFHDVLLEPFRVMLYYNNWQEKYDVDVPFIVLTTLDENKEKKEVKPNPDANGNNSNED